MKLRVGQEAPAFGLTLPDGRLLSSSEYAGAPVLLIFLRHLA